MQQPAAAGGVRLVGRARARLDEVVSVELVVLHSVGPVHVAVAVCNVRIWRVWVRRAGRKTKTVAPLAAPGPAGVCWFVVPMRFYDWAGEVDGVYLC